jgi:two-component system sensor histidine kinase RpfC
MLAPINDDLPANVRAQAGFRLKFGGPVALIIVCILYYVTSGSMDRHVVVLSSLGLYVGYALGVWLLSRTASRGFARNLVLVTAVVDPVFMSVWLYTAGDPAILFVGLYTFTVLGFGFRIGNWAMFLCQAVSIVGFSVVLLMSPNWGDPGLPEISQLVVMVMVPLYASSLIQKLHTAKALAEHESQAKSLLLAKVSHELRTPLTGIVSSAQLIEYDAGDTETGRRAQAIHEMAAGLDAEIERMLDLAKMAVKGPVSEPVAFKISTATDHVMRTLLPVASVKGLDLQLEIDPKITKSVVAGAKELDGILTNLAGNAIKFTQAGSVTIRVTLVAEIGDAYRILFSVSDTGIGIAPEHLPRIFEPFYQVENGANRKFGGTGLGTAIAMECVKRMGGVLQVKSELGRGTVFWFEVEMKHAAGSAGAAGVVEGPRIVRGKRIMIADDNRVNLELLKQMLLKDGHQVTTATNGAQALQLLARQDFDLVLLDFNMGDIDGLTVYQTYCFGRLHTAPTYFITADTTRTTGTRLAEAGAAGVIYKPITFERLRGAISTQFPDDAETSVVDEAFGTGERTGHRAGVGAEGTARARPRLRGVPVEYLDPAALEHLREIKDTPEFLFAMIAEGLEDLEATQGRLANAMRQHRMADVHHDAHTLRGVSMSFGAVRLAALAESLMSISEEGLAMDRASLLADLSQKYTQSVSALRELRDQYAPQQAEG